MKFKGNILKTLFLVSFLIIQMAAATSTRGDMYSYCTIPPFLIPSIPPNVLIVLDNSGSMNDLAYATTYDPSQFESGNYYGYFEPTVNYIYSSNNRWEVTIADPSTGTAANPIASGNFLNWATMRRVDVAKKILIGGKASPRSPAGNVTVKLYGENSSSSWNFQKDYDNTSVPGLIYPFSGDYRYRMSGDQLRITPLVSGSSTGTVYPSGNISVPAAWTVSGAASAWEAVDEVSSDGDTTYIQNRTTNANDQVILDYNYAGGLSGTIASVSVRVRAKKIGSGTRRIRGVLQVNGIDYFSSYRRLRTYYRTYDFNWSVNPATGAAWQWTDFKPDPAATLIGFGVDAYNSVSSSRYPRATQIYLVITVDTPSGGPYNITVDQGMEKAEGIIDNLSDDVKFGLTFYNYSEGAHVENYVDFGAAVNMVTTISNMRPSTWTPLAETLYEMTRFFRQDDPYYSNSPADYQTGENYDPYYYQYSKLPGSDLPDQYVPCAKSFILMLTDGESTQDGNIPTAYRDYDNDGNDPGSYGSNGTDYLDDVALWARTVDARPGTCLIDDDQSAWVRPCIPGMQNITLYSVFMFGRGSQLLKDAAINGGFDDRNNDGLPGPDLSEYMRDSNDDGILDLTNDLPLTYYEGDDGYSLERSIIDAIEAILTRASSGTAASVLASGEGSGANLLQAVFYQNKPFENSTDVDWISRLFNLWYYIDPRLSDSAIREDTTSDTPDWIQNLSNDYRIVFKFDTDIGETVVDIFDAGGTLVDTNVALEDINHIWEAGNLLWLRNLGTSPRDIKTTLLNTNPVTLIDFSTANAAALLPYLQAALAPSTEASDIIDYVHGIDQAGYRNRTVTDGGDTNVWKLGDIVSSTPRIQSSVNLNKYHESYDDSSYYAFINSNDYKNRGMAYTGANDGMLHAFKFGKFELEWTGQNKTIEVAKLSGTGLGEEVWAFIPKNALPYLKYLRDPDYCHLYYVDGTPYIFDASIKNPSGCTGDYWNCDKATDVDGSNNLNLNGTSWRTVIIGSMRTGGACKSSTTACTADLNKSGGIDSEDCVNTPGVDLNGDGDTLDLGENLVGYSSYFALDITEPDDPSLLWEFSHPDLGFSTTGPAVLRINARDFSDTPSVSDPDKNGKWFVVLASGPTGPIDTTFRDFIGYSDQSLKLFILDLKTGALLRTIDANDASLPAADKIDNAFGSYLVDALIDYDLDYQDDAIYLGYTKAEAAVGSSYWTEGGVIRLSTREDLDGASESVTALDPDNWQWSHVIKDTGSVTAAVTQLAFYPTHSKIPNEGWLYFGTGRYFHATDDLTTQRILFGIKEPCVTTTGFDPDCTDELTPFCTGNDVYDATCGDLTNVTTNVQLSDAAKAALTGWYINLEGPDNTNLSGAGESNVTTYAERSIVAPVPTPIGVVFFSTFAPGEDICEYGGTTYLWALEYNSGGEGSSRLRGTVLMQLSTGEIVEIDLSTAFTEKFAEVSETSTVQSTGRRTGGATGIAGGGFVVVVPPAAIDKILHIEKQ